ncbi:hypothetical protein [Saccharopolyspora phatthalungensis]|uniref:Uncharacterized protein n=1 Tax=Saccharopolyspora phatthalungensis TaxID=664693 RepID=A0A840Q8F1_9PSEU|nr:hypothetical protein [Saccharopolyspora phatthalungensis]MBB5154899.1 hypothetical protein [Saccharopolyspora phatthalungensis]
MGIRREAAVVLAALGTLTVSASVVAATAWAGPPLHVEMGKVECHTSADLLSRIGLPKSLADKADNGAPAAMVPMTFRSADGQRVSYSVTVDGKQRASGSVSGGGQSINSVTIDGGKSSRLVVTTGPTVLVDRMVAGRC